MRYFLKYIPPLPGIIFLFLGFYWLTDPGAAAQLSGMTLLDGIGRSGQIGYMTAYFMGGCIMVFVGVITKQPMLLQAAAMIIALTVVFRVIPWLFHDVELATQLTVTEIIFTTTLLFRVSRMPRNIVNDNKSEQAQQPAEL